MMNKKQKQQKYEQIQRNCMPVIEAKDYAIHKMIEVGKKMGKARYIMLAVLFIFLFTYHFCFSLFVQMRMKEKLARALACVLVAALTLSGVNLTAFAEETLTGNETPVEAGIEVVEAPQEPEVQEPEAESQGSDESPTPGEIPTDTPSPSEAPVETPGPSETTAETPIPEEPTVTPSGTPEIHLTEQPILMAMAPGEGSSVVEDLQARIDALPSGEAFQSMSEEEQENVYNEYAAISEDLLELTEEEQALLDMSKLYELQDAIFGGVSMLGGAPSQAYAITSLPTGETVYPAGTWFVNNTEEPLFIYYNGVYKAVNIYGSSQNSEVAKNKCFSFDVPVKYNDYNSTQNICYFITGTTTILATISESPSVYSNIPYNGTARELLASGGKASNGTMKYRLYASPTSNDYSEYSNYRDIKATNIGTYKVGYYADANPGYTDSKEDIVKINIVKGTPSGSMIPATPTVNAVSYKTKLSAISLGTDWNWVEDGSTVPNAGTANHTVEYTKAIDTKNYDWSGVDGYISTTNKIRRNVSLTVNPILAQNSQVVVPTGLSATYSPTLKLSSITLKTGWVWSTPSTPLQAGNNLTFPAVYTVPSPDNTNYNWSGISGYKMDGNKVTITRTLTVNVANAAQNAPTNLSASGETIRGKADGSISGVSAEMQYRNKNTSNTDYITITGNTISDLPAGTYCVRLKAKPNYNASPDTEVTVAAGTPLTVTLPGTRTGYTITTVSGNPAALTYNSTYEFRIVKDSDYYLDTSMSVPTVLLGGTSVTPVSSSGGTYTYRIANIVASKTMTVSGFIRYNDQIGFDNGGRLSEN